MNNIEQYKKRFYNLMESTMGDVRPIISEQPVRQSTPPTNPPRPGTSPRPSTPSRTTTPPPSNPKMTDSQYFMNKVVVSDTQAILDKFKGKSMYLYKKNGTCQSSGGKNVVFIDGKEAQIEKYTSGVPVKLGFIRLETENRDGSEIPRISDGKLYVLITFDNAYDMVKDASGGAPLIHYGTDSSGEQGFNRFDDKGNVSQVDSGVNEGITLMYDFATKKWSHLEDPRQSYQPCLLNAIQNALPNGLKTPERTDTDFGYNPGQDDASRA